MSETDLTKRSDVTRHIVINADVRFEFALPPDLPRENRVAYGQKRLEHLMEKLARLKNLSISYTLR